MLCHGHYNNGSDARRADNVRINEEKISVYIFELGVNDDWMPLVGIFQAQVIKRKEPMQITKD